MTSAVSPAKTMMEVARTVQLTPLGVGDLRYVNLAPGSDTDDLEMLRQKLADVAAGVSDENDENRQTFLKILVSSHRGCGKTTELLRIESDMQQDFTSLHLGLDESLRDEFDYTLFCLWLTEELVDQFHKAGMPLPPARVELIESWFAEKIINTKLTISASGSVEAEAEARASAGAFGFGLGFLGKFKTALRGDRNQQVETKQILRKYSRELIDQVNHLFITAAQTLRQHGRPERLLIVQDNLDRLNREAAIEFFEKNGEILHDLNAHMIFTPPNAVTLANRRIQNIFHESYIIPMVKVKNIRGEVHTPGVETLRAVILKRIDPSLFADPTLMDQAIALSGGCVRDLMRLLSRAALRARSKKRDQMISDDLTNAMGMMLDEFETGLIPSKQYFDWLADIHRHQRDGLQGDWRTEERFAGLVLMGAVLAYKNRKNWYDIHPVILNSWLFEEAMQPHPTDPGADGSG